MKNVQRFVGRAIGLSIGFIVALLSCQEGPGDDARQVNEYPFISPDYRFVTIPVNIAPLNFTLPGSSALRVDFLLGDELLFSANRGKKQTDFSLRTWRKMLAKAKDRTITVQIWAKNDEGWSRYKPFTIDVTGDSIDATVVYRLIEPGYGMWNRLTINQRNLSTFEERVVFDNSLVGNGCMNCHVFLNYSPARFMMHVRKKNGGGTIIADGESIVKVDVRNPFTGQSVTYPHWHPGGRYIAYSSNDTQQFFYAHSDQRIEVYDRSSDLVIYDIQENRLLADSLFNDATYWETFPAWSADGKWLYFCRAQAIDSLDKRITTLKYRLCRTAFDENTGRLSHRVDTLTIAGEEEKSVSFPRISPDGRYLLYTLSDFATFPIWHKEADLRMIDLNTGESVDLSTVNSDCAEGYHSWSSTGRWIVFSSRRDDGLYTRFYFAYFDRNGKVHKPFILPQQNPEFYHLFLKSYNIPEFVNGEIQLTPYEWKEGVNGSLVVPKNSVNE